MSRRDDLGTMSLDRSGDKNQIYYQQPAPSEGT